MFYLYQPTAVETLSVRGRYAWQDAAGTTVAEERWERYRQAGTTVEVWRASRTMPGGALLSHAVMNEQGGIERLKLRWRREGHPSQSLTLTFEADTVLVSDGAEWQSVAMPAGYGLAVPLLSLARLGLPFDLAREQHDEAALYVVLPRDPAFHHRTAMVSYRLLGLREMTIRGEPLRARGWRMTSAGLPSRDLWFDRHGTCLAVQRDGAPDARLVEWTRFG